MDSQENAEDRDRHHHEGASEEAPIKLRPKDKEELTQQRG